MSTVLICQFALFATAGTDLQTKQTPKDLYDRSVLNPMHHLAPFGALAVICGCVISCFWTIFPYALQDDRLLGRELGTAVFLLTKFYKGSQLAVTARLTGTDEVFSRDRLWKVCHQVVGQLLSILASLRSRLDHQKHDIPIAEASTQAKYEAFLSNTHKLLDHIMLMEHATVNWSEIVSKDPAYHLSNPHLEAFAKNLTVSSKQVIFTLAVLLGALNHGSPLPPQFQGPQAEAACFMCAKSWQGIDSDRLSAMTLAALAVTQAMSVLICTDLACLIHIVKDLVDEVCFDVMPRRKML